MAGTIWNGMLIIPMELMPFFSPEYFTDQPKKTGKSSSENSSNKRGKGYDSIHITETAAISMHMVNREEERKINAKG